MCFKDLLLILCLIGILGGFRITSTTTTTTFVAAMSIGNQDLERYFRSINASQTLAAMTEDRIALDTYTYAFLNYSYYNEQHEKVEVQFKEEKARYGEGKTMSVKGKLVHISDVDDFTDDFACSPNILGTLGNPTPAAGVPWIALVRRGHCTFEEKVKHVHAKGAAGVIIFNDKPAATLEKMQIKGKTRNITAVITYKEIGTSMASIVDRGADMETAIIEGRSGIRPINTLNRTSVLFVSISFIILMVISLVWLIFYYIQRFRYLQTKDQQSRHLCSVTKKAIMKIPTKTGKSSDEKDADSDCCAICIEAYKASDCIRVLPCKHEFHKNCIDPWLIEHRTCPMCKLDVLKFYGYVVGDQIHSTPSPQHTPPNVAPLNDNEVPVIVLAIATHTAAVVTPQDQHTQNTNVISSRSGASDNTSGSGSASGSASGSGSHSISNPNSNSYSDNTHSCSNHPSGITSSNGQRLNENTATVGRSNSRRNSAPPIVLQVSTASRQVTDV